MRRNFILFFTFIFLFVGNVQAESLKFAYDPWCPYTCDKKEGKPGILSELVEEIFKGTKYRVQFEVVPWSRAVEGARRGEYSGIIGAFKPDAPDFVFPDKEQALATNCFFTKNTSSWSFKSESDLKEKHIGVIKGYSYSEIDKFLESLPPKWLDRATGQEPLLKNLKKLLVGRLDVVLEEGRVMNNLAKREGKEKEIRNAGCLKEVNKTFVALSPKLPHAKEVAKIISEGTLKAQKNGTIKRIEAKY